MPYFLKLYLPLTSGMAPKWISMLFMDKSVNLTCISLHAKSADFICIKSLEATSLYSYALLWI